MNQDIYNSNTRNGRKNNRRNMDFRSLSSPKNFSSSEDEKEELICSVFEPRCKRKAQFVCTECGKPVCGGEFCSWKLEEDSSESFAASKKPENPHSISNPPTKAIYCSDCIEEIYNPSSFIKYLCNIFNKKYKRIYKKWKRLKKRRKKGT